MDSIENNTNITKNLKYSTIGILSFVFCMLSLIPTALNIITGGLLNNVIKVLNIDVIFAIWLFVFMFAALILAIIDLRKQNRLKGLTRAALIISTIFLVLFLSVLFTLTIYSPT